MPGFPKILLFGSTGQVGTEMRELLTRGGYQYVAIDRKECDLSQPSAVTGLIRDVKPKVIVNAAAYTSVDRAESDRAIASAVNAAAPSEMARAARELGAIFIHYSTDYVFNGEHSTPWVESDATSPLNVYGQTKLDGENGIAEAQAASFIFRTSWVFGVHRVNFLLTMLRQGASRDELSVVRDQVGAPTWSQSLAEVTMHTIRRFTRVDGTIDLDSAASKAGIYHATCSGVTNWYGFACSIFDEARAQGRSLRIKRVLPLSSSEYPCTAARPKYSVLSNDKLRRELEFVLPDWRVALRSALKDLHARE